MPLFPFRRADRALLLLAIFVGLWAFTPGEITAGTQATGSSQAQPEQGLLPLPVFEVHSNFWVNLHHFLYQQTRLQRETTQGGSQTESGGGAQLVQSIPASLESLTPGERKAWTTAMNYYLAHYADRDLLFNGDMVILNDRLSEMDGCPDLAGRVVTHGPEPSGSRCTSGLRSEVIEMLQSAAVVYRAHWWAEHDRANRAWIAAVGPLVRQSGTKLALELAAIYRANWPPGRLHVDMVGYAGPFGAYTSLDPVHLTITSTDPRNQGPGALEVLFHEASHALAEGVRDAIVRECRRLGKPIPRDLWHALLFYTTGEMVKRTLDAHGGQSSAPQRPEADGYTPYAYRYGLYARGWTSYQRALERSWQPYLEGKVEFDRAILRLVTNL
jgi:hypothetical protein